MSDLLASFLIFLDHTIFTHTRTHPEGLYSVSDRLVTEASNYTTQQTQETDIRIFIEIRNHKPNNPEGSDLQLRLHSHKDRRYVN